MVDAPKNPSVALVDLVYRNPAEVLTTASETLSQPDLDGAEHANARWARGFARRELGDLEGAEDDLRVALELAAMHLPPTAASRIATTLALVLVYRGDPAGAERLLDDAEPDAAGADLGHLWMQRALIAHRRGALDAALDGYEAALAIFADLGDDAAEARAHNNISVLHAYRLDVDQAIAHSARAVEIADKLDQPLLAAAATHNVGYALACAGELASSLDLMADAERRLRHVDGAQHHLAIVNADRANVLLQANLIDEARRAADTALDAIGRGGNVTDRCDLELLAARCRLADGDLEAACAAARDAAAGFLVQGRHAWLPLAEFVELQADARRDDSPELAARAERIADELEERRWVSEAMSARVLAGRLMLERGDVTGAKRALTGLDPTRRARPAGERAAGHLATALLHEALDDRPKARQSVSDGLRTVQENHATLGAIELRAHVLAHAHALAEVGARLAIDDRRPRELLAMIESARGMNSLVQRAHAPDDPELASALTELRAVNVELLRSIGEGAPDPDVRRRRLQLETRIRDQTRRAQASGTVESADLRSAIDQLGDTTLIEYGNIDGQLWAVTASRGRCRMHEIGPVNDIEPAIDSIDFALHRLNRLQGSIASRAAAANTLREVGLGLQRRLLPASVVRSERSVVIVPTGRLHGLAWRALPALATRPTSVSPSLSAWAVGKRAASASRPTSVALIAGPDLPAAPAELAELITIYPDAVALSGAAASADACVEVLASASVAHLVCHGAFRSDNPLFSTLRVADGDLTVYDLERCERLPKTMVLSACSAAVSSVLRGGALLGISSALIQLGVSSVVAALNPVSDERSVDLMARFHTHLASGATPAAALALTSSADGRLDDTSASYVVIGC